MDSLTVLFVLLGGLCGGTYPVPIKDPKVLAAKVHPVVFQLYKSSWVFLTGLLFLVPIYLNNQTVGYQFSWWGVFSSLAWIPSGTLCIAAVPRIGVATTTVANCACATVLSFFVGWLVLEEGVKQHSLNGVTFYMAPVYICCTLLGMAALTYSPAISISSACERKERQCRRRFLRAFGWLCCWVKKSPNFDYRSSKSLEDHARDFEAVSEEPPSPACHVLPPSPYGSSASSLLTSSSCCSSSSSSASSLLSSPVGQQTLPITPTKGKGEGRVDWRSRMIGVLCASLAGVFSASQYALVNLGAKYERERSGCDKMSECPAPLAEAFNNFGSWMVTFGGGALGSSLALLLAVAVLHRAMGQPVPPLEFKVMAKPGSAAGILWCLGNFFNTAAVVRGGNAIVLPQILSVQLLTCGSWGLFYYKEVQGCRSWLWIVSALLTLGAIVLLGGEKG